MKAKEEKEKELAELVKEHNASILRICKVYFPYDYYLRKDLYNEIVYRIWRGLNTFRNDSSVRTWIYKLSINTAIELSQAEKRNRKKMEVLAELADRLSGEKDPLSNELYRMIDRLSSMEKAVIYMYLDRNPQSVIAETLGLTETNVSTMVGRIKLKLKKFKEDENANI